MVIVIPAYPMVVLGCRVECPELRFTEGGAIEVLERLVSPHFLDRLHYERYLCEAIGGHHFKRAWKAAAWGNETTYAFSLSEAFCRTNKRLVGAASHARRAKVMGYMLNARLQWARYIAASIVDAMYEPVVLTGFNNLLSDAVRKAIYTRAGVPW